MKVQANQPTTRTAAAPRAATNATASSGNDIGALVDSVGQLVNLLTTLAEAWGGVNADPEAIEAAKKAQEEQIKMMTEIRDARQRDYDIAVGMATGMNGQNDMQMQILGGMLPGLNDMLQGNGLSGAGFNQARSMVGNSGPAWAGLFG
ncbi:MAG: hypothetical protein KC910_07205 [Candidatus Eremiobacteraeota bacterium]|nr:hypothetical protein [Candidatus Eremiobacteraeota bacterium]